MRFGVGGRPSTWGAPPRLGCAEALEAARSASTADASIGGGSGGGGQAADDRHGLGLGRRLRRRHGLHAGASALPAGAGTAGGFDPPAWRRQPSTAGVHVLRDDAPERGRRRGSTCAASKVGDHRKRGQNLPSRRGRVVQTTSPRATPMSAGAGAVAVPGHRRLARQRASASWTTSRTCASRWATACGAIHVGKSQDRVRGVAAAPQAGPPRHPGCARARRPRRLAARASTWWQLRDAADHRELHAPPSVARVAPGGRPRPSPFLTSAGHRGCTSSRSRVGDG